MSILVTGVTASVLLMVLFGGSETLTEIIMSVYEVL